MVQIFLASPAAILRLKFFPQLFLPVVSGGDALLRGFLRLSICSGASGSVTTEDVASMLIGLGVKKNVDLRKLALAGDFLLYLQTFFGQPSGSVVSLEL